MLRDISTRRKLFLLCAAFVVAIAVAIYISIAEKQIAIDFTNKELDGARHIEQFHEVSSPIRATIPRPRNFSTRRQVPAPIPKLRKTSCGPLPSKTRWRGCCKESGRARSRAMRSGASSPRRWPRPKN
jgi:hypothetical protein